MVLSTTPAMMTRKKIRPRTARTPSCQLSTIQLTFSVTAIATRQMPRTVKKMTDRRRPLIMVRSTIDGSGLGVQCFKRRIMAVPGVAYVEKAGRKPAFCDRRSPGAVYAASSCGTCRILATFEVAHDAERVAAASA